MKKLIIILVAVFMSANIYAQIPQKMSYQAVIRNASNALVSSQTIGIQISILQGSTTGTAVYIETQTPSTNANGLVSLEIGTGTIVSGTFSSIDWANGTYFIKTETDPSGGSSYTITGTSQLLSVPYALHAKTAESISGTNQYYLGQEALGGVIFYLYKGSDGNQHGLVVNKNESTAQWQATGTVTNATRSWDGVYNTNLMTSSAAATYVNNLTDGGFTDWYLPSVDELSLLWHNRFFVNKTLNTGSFSLLSNSGFYWSSTEADITNAFYFNIGFAVSNTKSNSLLLRGIRAF